MSTSTLSLISTLMVAIRWTLTISSEKKSTLYLPPPESDSKIRESATQDLNRGERFNGHDVDPVTRKSGSTTTTQRQTMKVHVTKAEKTQWTRLIKIFPKIFPMHFDCLVKTTTKMMEVLIDIVSR
ncbi:hypothetical protein HID58_045806 [Brassica napus]|uniref:Uncharacterized protein n=1 Tax=Brassica napus TaxID=3708 RepID=A0ABQ8AUT2_BRANA|nr:SUN domain-containing protein 2-like [Brassica napus]KAH0896238.1 hypothetical protein HID58_045806 [Brassica napus]